jgi:hypothetical protein
MKIGSPLQKLGTKETLTVGATDGSLVIANATDVFSSIANDFMETSFLEKSHPTESASIETYQLVEDMNFAQIFSAFKRSFEQLYFTQHQIVDVIKKYPDQVDYYKRQTLLLLKTGEQFFPINVFLFGGGSKICIAKSNMGRSSIWHGKGNHRIIVPKLIYGHN